jgi:hypothetical protein
MSKHYSGLVPSGESDGTVEQNDFRTSDASLRGPDDKGPAASDSLPHTDELEGDYAEIARAVIALRKAQPALEPSAETSLDDPLAITPPRPPSVWLVIGALWFLLALVAGCAVVSMAHWTPAHAGLGSAHHASIGVSIRGGGKRRANDDLQVQPERPIVDIK